MNRYRRVSPVPLSSCSCVEREIEAHCLACGRFANLRAIELIDNLGNIAVIDVAQHLHCRDCGSRWCETRPDYAVRSFVNGRPVI